MGHDLRFVSLGGTEVDFGTVAWFWVDDGTSLTAPSPTADPGTVDVTVSLGGGGGATSTVDRFAFVGASTVSSPSAGDIGGGGSVTITGADLAGAYKVDFGGVSIRTPARWTVGQQ